MRGKTIFIAEGNREPQIASRQAEAPRRVSGFARRSLLGLSAGYLKAYRMLVAIVVVGLLLFAGAAPASAHDQPDGANWLMADWMLLSFLVFFGAALVVFLVALKLGALRNIEDAKYHILSINEPDYYTPDWAKEDSDAAYNTDSITAER